MKTKQVKEQILRYIEKVFADDEDIDICHLSLRNSKKDNSMSWQYKWGWFIQRRKKNMIFEVLGQIFVFCFLAAGILASVFINPKNIYLIVPAILLIPITYFTVKFSSEQKQMELYLFLQTNFTTIVFCCVMIAISMGIYNSYKHFNEVRDKWNEEL